MPLLRDVEDTVPYKHDFIPLCGELIWLFPNEKDFD